MLARGSKYYLKATSTSLMESADTCDFCYRAGLESSNTDNWSCYFSEEFVEKEIKPSWVYFSIKQNGEQFIADKHIIIGPQLPDLHHSGSSNCLTEGLGRVKDVGSTWETIGCLSCEGLLPLLLAFFSRVHRRFWLPSSITQRAFKWKGTAFILGCWEEPLSNPPPMWMLSEFSYESLTHDAFIQLAWNCPWFSIIYPTTIHSLSPS